MSTGKADDRLTVTQVAALVGVSQNSVRAWVKRGYIRAEAAPGYGYAHRLLLNRDDVEQVRRARATGQKLVPAGEAGESPMSPDPTDDRLTTAQAATLLGMNPDAVRSLIARGRLSAEKEHLSGHGPRLLLKREDVEQLREERAARREKRRTAWTEWWNR